MFSKDIATYFRAMTDDPDLTFINDAQLAVLLEIAYNEFRRLVCTIDQSFYEIAYNGAAPNANFLSLDNLMLGAVPTQPRLEKITRVCATDGATPPTIRALFRPASSFESLVSGSTFGDQSYWLQNKVLRFNSVIQTPIQIQYIPASSFNWAAGIAANIYLDDVAVEFGDVIALLAMQSYKIKDFQEQPMQLQQLQKRLTDMKKYLAVTRSGDAARFVSSYDGSYVGGA